jgi:hypothetical protein
MKRWPVVVVGNIVAMGPGVDHRLSSSVVEPSNITIAASTFAIILVEQVKDGLKDGFEGVMGGLVSVLKDAHADNIRDDLVDIIGYFCSFLINSIFYLPILNYLLLI